MSTKLDLCFALPTFCIILKYNNNGSANPGLNSRYPLVMESSCALNKFLSLIKKFLKRSVVVNTDCNPILKQRKSHVQILNIIHSVMRKSGVLKNFTLYNYKNRLYCICQNILKFGKSR